MITSQFTNPVFRTNCVDDVIVAGSSTLGEDLKSIYEFRTRFFLNEKEKLGDKNVVCLYIYCLFLHTNVCC